MAEKTNPRGVPAPQSSPPQTAPPARSAYAPPEYFAGSGGERREPSGPQATSAASCSGVTGRQMNEVYAPPQWVIDENEGVPAGRLYPQRYEIAGGAFRRPDEPRTAPVYGAPPPDEPRTAPVYAAPPPDELRTAPVYAAPMPDEPRTAPVYAAPPPDELRTAPVYAAPPPELSGRDAGRRRKGLLGRLFGGRKKP